MIKFFILSLLCFAAGLLIQQPDTFATIEVFHYRIYASLFTWAGCFFLLIFACKFLLLPFTCLQFFSKKYQQHKEVKKKSFIETIFQALINQNVENFEKLSNQAKKLFKPEEPLYWEIQTLLFPNKENYQQLTMFSQTVMGGIRGLFTYADSEGDFEQMHQLLKSLSPKQLATPWAQQALFQMAVQEKDWEEAFKNLKNLKPLLTKEEYYARQAVLLLLLGKTKEAYKADELQPAVAIAWAKENPKKALKILQPVWALNPNREVYQTLKKLNGELSEKDQIKQIKSLISANKHHRLSLLALADIYLSCKQPLKAKNQLDEFLSTHPFTRQVAQMMARVEREAWNHEEQAKAWEDKGNQIEEDDVWTCSECGNKFATWSGCCPSCHTFNSLK